MSELTPDEREWIANMLADALTPHGRDFDPEDAARLIEARLETLLRRTRAATLREVANAWQWSEWTVLTEPIKADSQPVRIIGAAQAVTNWLRERADQAGGV